MDYYKEALKLHYEWAGKINISTKLDLSLPDILSYAYTPGVAAPCLEIQKNNELGYKLTNRHNTIAVISDGSAVLGLGDIGPEASMPVMEGKSLLFKLFGDVDAVPLCIKTNNVENIVKTIQLISGSFGGINLEDISSPRCFEIEEQLKQVCDIPIFHDDQHGTAIVVLAALINSLRFIKKDIDTVKIVLNGPGAAGIAIIKMLLHIGIKNIVAVDEFGILSKNRLYPDNKYKEEISKTTNPYNNKGELIDALVHADVFIGTSVANCLTQELMAKMNKQPIIFALANPEPEINPIKAKDFGAAVVCTGRSDFPNQVNNLLAFPGLFRGVLDCRANDITMGMKISAAYAIADIIPLEQLNSNNILPSIFDKQLKNAVANAVINKAREEGIAKN